MFQKYAGYNLYFQKFNLNMSTKLYLLDQLKTTYNERGWLVPFTVAVENLDAEKAALTDTTGSHSVWGIVDHMIFWNERWLTRLKGGNPGKVETENSATFEANKKDESAWNDTVKKLSGILAEVIKIVETSDDKFLSAEAFPGYGSSWYEMFAQYNLHNAYHIGQIVQLRKLHQCWDDEQGIKG